MDDAQPSIHAAHRALRRALAVSAALILALPCAVALAARPPRSHVDPVDVPASPVDVRAVNLFQSGDEMVFDLTTAGAWQADQLATGSGRSVCVKLFYGHLRTPRSRICVIAAAGATALRYTRLDPFGHPFRVRPLQAEVTRRDAHSLRARFAPASAGLRPGRYSWQAQTAWTDAETCTIPGACSDLVPDGGNVIGRIRPNIPIGCTPRGATHRRAGTRGRGEVALTFDDGPSRYTPAVLSALESQHVPATFFLVGQQVSGHGALLRRMLRDGDMIGNHTLSHANVAAGGAFAAHQITATQTLIRRASGFKPCLFRPPYGATTNALTSTVRGLGAMSILWDVDPQDWRTPGIASIVANVLHNARGGSIILLHDGGGPRSQTLAALPAIITGLRARGLHFVTVADLLRLHMRVALDAPQPDQHP